MTSAEYNDSVSLHSDKLFRYALHFLKNSDDAQDVVQDAFEKLWLNRKNLELEKVKSWLFTCVHNAMINQVNRQKTRHLHLASLDQNRHQKPDSQFESSQVVDFIVSFLPPVQKSILLLRDLEGYSYEEIGEILSLNASQVKVYLFRARVKIKKQLKGIFELA